MFGHSYCTFLDCSGHTLVCPLLYRLNVLQVHDSKNPPLSMKIKGGFRVVVHYLRFVGPQDLTPQEWSLRWSGHFFPRTLERHFIFVCHVRTQCLPGKEWERLRGSSCVSVKFLLFQSPQTEYEKFKYFLGVLSCLSESKISWFVVVFRPKSKSYL